MVDRRFIMIENLKDNKATCKILYSFEANFSIIRFKKLQSQLLAAVCGVSGSTRAQPTHGCVRGSGGA
jgi:hypothetical protein